MEDWESWQKAGLTLDEWIAHVLRRAADRRELAKYQAEHGNAGAAQQLMRLALAGELYAASIRGEQTADEARVVGALLPAWTGTSSAELLAVVRDILAAPAVTS